jgi:hypothetical protein
MAGWPRPNGFMPAHEIFHGPKTRYLLRVSLTGRSGLLRIRVQGAFRTDDRRKAEFARCLVVFPDEDMDSRRKLVLQPSATLHISDAPTQRSWRAQLHLLWRPDADNAYLAGEVILTPVEMPRALGSLSRPPR